jgi:sulfur transfer complex TusBCD TusB component (DsrH family)
MAKGSADPSPNLLPVQDVPGDEISAILIQDGVTLRDVPARHVYALAEDALARHITPAFPTVSYQEMLKMMFEADSVIAV